MEAFAYVAAFLLAGILFLAIILTLAKWIRPNRPNVEKLSTYESGEAPVGNANIRFNPRFYLIALMFVLFEIELIFLFPWASVFHHSDLEKSSSSWSTYALVEMFIFVGILALGLALAWVKGYVDWEKNVPPEIPNDSPIPDHAYHKIREKYRTQKN
ncbi:NADH-quinone oxidoreductase subunit A [Aquirufa rosea]|uniref:NADH-quinone oxidoreductase subunit n=1 Tax=Aquirufa rosea TaxID=2509241 RepID=A0A4V1M5C4_9BACT|nr:NADH-quinone oxidoreductase subunit A [Aquirufa rosea]RXK48236.1 NADH-quinone oxidoreductase subunit A [Aquirufa rosea]